MDKIILSLLTAMLILFIPLSLYFEWQRIENNEVLYENGNAYVCKNGYLYQEKIKMHMKMSRRIYIPVENEIFAICKGNKIYKMEK